MAILALISCNLLLVYSMEEEIFTSPDLVPRALTTVRISGNATLNPSSVAVLSEILETLESIKSLRMRDFEQLKLRENKTGNNSVSDYIASIDKGMDRMQPIRKTYGYKVTMYKHPFGAEKPIVYKQNIEVDDRDPDLVYPLDLIDSESKNIEKKLPKPNHPSTKSHQGSRSLDKESSSRHLGINEKEREKYSKKKANKVHKVTDVIENSDIEEHEKEGGREHSVREKTQIEYYEKERFVDTELPHSKEHHHRISPELDSYTRNQLLGAQETFPQAIYEMPTGTTSGDASYLSLLPYSYYGNTVLPSDGELIKSPQNFPHVNPYNANGRPYIPEIRSPVQAQNFRSPPVRDKSAGHLWEGFRERGYKITSQKEFVVKDRHKNKDYGRRDAAHKTFKTSLSSSHNEKGQREQSYSKKTKGAAFQSSSHDKRKHNRNNHKGYIGDLDHSSNKNEDVFIRNNSRNPGFGSRYRHQRGNNSEASNNVSTTGQPSIAEIIKVSIEEAVNRSKNSIRERAKNVTTPDFNPHKTSSDTELTTVINSQEDVPRSVYSYTIDHRSRKRPQSDRVVQLPMEEDESEVDLPKSRRKPTNRYRYGRGRHQRRPKLLQPSLHLLTLPSGINHQKEDEEDRTTVEHSTPLQSAVDRNIKSANNDFDSNPFTPDYAPPDTTPPTISTPMITSNQRKHSDNVLLRQESRNPYWFPGSLRLD